MNFTNFIGVDVAKNKIDIFNLKTNEHMTIANRTKGIEKTFSKIEKEGTLVLLENTGGYEKNCIDALIQLGFAIHRTENRSFKSYIRSLGQKAKTDLIDAKALAQYGQERQKDLKLYQKPAETDEELKQLLTYLEELKKQRAAHKNRLQSPGYWDIKDIIEETIRRLDEIITQIENKIKELIKKSKKISKKIEGMLSYKGVSLTTATKIVVYLTEIGEIQTRKVVALSGLAPYVRESGTLKMYTTTSGYGRSKVKSALYMAALSAIRFNEKISSFYKRLLANGKKKKVALVACMRKMIILLNAIVRDGFNKELTQNTGGVSC